MADERKDILAHLDAKIKLLRLVMEDKEVNEKFKALMVSEIEFNRFLLGMGNEKAPEQRGDTFEETTLKKLKTNWRDWAGKIFNKINSMLGSIIPTGGTTKG